MNFLNRKPREIGRLRTEYSPPKAQTVDEMIERMKAMDQAKLDWIGNEPPKCQQPHEIDLLEELAVILRRLTWSQMQEYSTGTGSDPQKVHEWSAK